MRLTHLSAAAAWLISILGVPVLAHAATKPHIFQLPSLSRNLIAFGYAGDLWTVPREGGRATRLTTGVGIETAPVLASSCFSAPGKNRSGPARCGLGSKSSEQHG